MNDSSYQFKIDILEGKYEEVKTMKTITIQVQIKYTRKNWMKGLTVHTMNIEIEKEDEDVELCVDVVQKYKTNNNKNKTIKNWRNWKRNDNIW